MKVLQPLAWSLTLASSFALSFVAGTTWAAPGHHHHAPAAAEAPAGKWATDLPLRGGMARIRQAVEQAGQPQSMSDAQARALSRDIQTATAFMVEHCTLPPQADAALHGVLAELLQGADALPRAAEREQASARIVAALAHYPELFADPDWDGAQQISARH